MNVYTYPSVDAANDAAAELLAQWLTARGTRTVMVAAGNTPLDLYRRIAQRKLSLDHLIVFALDDYVGVPLDDSRNCANLLRCAVADAWHVKEFHAVSSLEAEALASVQEHEHRIRKSGGLDVVVLGLGQNGHLGFNEPGSAPDSVGRIVDLDSISIEANRKWFAGKYAPARGVTVGLKTVLAGRRIMLLAYGAHKTDAVTAMVHGPASTDCPASFLQDHGDTHVFLDDAAAAGLASA
jgi:glucosamine-6-phosphate deaminase